MARRAFPVAHTRSVALVGHRSSGKTTLGDLLLYTAGVTRSPGRPDAGTSLLDHHADERRRRMSIYPDAAWSAWDDHLVQLIDTPGSALLGHEAALAALGADTRLIVVSGSDGVEFGTEPALERVDGQVRLVVVNKLDRPLEPGLQADLEALSGARVVPLQLPFVDDEGRVSGVVDVLAGQVLRYDPEGSGSFSAEPLPRHLQQARDLAREQLVEAVALTDDALLDHYLEDLDLSQALIYAGLAAGSREGLLLPLLYTSASQAIGAVPLLDWIVKLGRRVKAPVARAFDGSPQPVAEDGPMVLQLLFTRLDEDGERYHVLRVWGGRAAPGPWTHGATGAVGRVRKLYEIRGPRRATAHNLGPGAVIATWDPLPGRAGDTFTAGARLSLPAPARPPAMMASLLVPVGPGDEIKLPEALQQLIALDPVLALQTDDESGGVLLAAVSEAHLERAVKTLAEQLGVRVRRELPPVAYRETPAQSVQGIQGVYERAVDGLIEEFGACELELGPGQPNENQIEWAAQGDQVPERFSASVGQGARRAMRHGPTAGYPVVGAKLRVVGGDYDILSSTDDHFQKAGEIATQSALAQAGTHLLEPWCEVDVTTPADDVGDVISALASKRGRILGVDPHGRQTLVRAVCPYRELRTFAPRLQTVTQGRGHFCTRPSHYDRVPAELISEAIHTSPYIDRRPAGGYQGQPAAPRRAPTRVAKKP